jgi:hypothetical protein
MEPQIKHAKRYLLSTIAKVFEPLGWLGNLVEPTKDNSLGMRRSAVIQWYIDLRLNRSNVLFVTRHSKTNPTWDSTCDWYIDLRLNRSNVLQFVPRHSKTNPLLFFQSHNGTANQICEKILDVDNCKGFWTSGMATKDNPLRIRRSAVKTNRLDRSGGIWPPLPRTSATPQWCQKWDNRHSFVWRMIKKNQVVDFLA